MRRLLPRRSGSALLLVLWCVAVLSVTVLAVAQMVIADVGDASLQNRRFEGRELALTGIAYGSNARIEPWDPLLDQTLSDGSRLRVTVRSESARLDINRLLRERDRRTLKELLRIWEVPSEKVSQVVDSLVDWIDIDQFRGLNGAERDDLKDQTRYSLPANRDFRSVAEMEKVRGMDLVAAVKPDWAEYFTVNGGRRLSLQEAPVDILRAAGGLSAAQANAIELARNGPDRLPHTRDDVKIKDPAAFLDRIGLTEAQRQLVLSRFSAGGGLTRIESRATVGGLDYRIIAVANRANAGGEGAVLAWEER